MSSEINPEGMAVARQYARWHLGDRSWADLIIEAYLNPEPAKASLEAAMGDEA